LVPVVIVQFFHWLVFFLLLFTQLCVAFTFFDKLTTLSGYCSLLVAFSNFQGNRS